LTDHKSFAEIWRSTDIVQQDTGIGFTDIATESRLILLINKLVIYGSNTNHLD